MKLRFRIGAGLNRPLIELNRHVGAVRFQLRSFGRNLYLLTRRADLELSVDAGAGIRGHFNVFILKDLESLRLDSDRVDIGNQVRNGVVAALIRRVAN